MADQRAEIIRLLELLGIAQEWHVVKPLPGEIRDRVLIQNEARQIKVEVPLSSENIQNLSDEKKIAMIRNALVESHRAYVDQSSPRVPIRHQKLPTEDGDEDVRCRIGIGIHLRGVCLCSNCTAVDHEGERLPPTSSSAKPCVSLDDIDRAVCDRRIVAFSKSPPWFFLVRYWRGDGS